MTLTPEKDLAQHVRFIAMYEDGSRDVFAVSGTNELKGLGSNIMQSLAARLRGEITFVGEGGMTTRVVFPATI